MVNPPSALISQFPAAATGTAATAATASDSSYRAADQRRRHAAAPAGGSADRRDQAIQLARSAHARNRGRAPTTSISGSPMIDQASSAPAATGTHRRAGPS